MSTILKALRRLEEEKAQEERDQIESQQVVVPLSGAAATRRGPTWWPAMLLAISALVLSAAVLVWVLREGPHEEPLAVAAGARGSAPSSAAGAGLATATTPEAGRATGLTAEAGLAPNARSEAGRLSPTPGTPPTTAVSERPRAMQATAQRPVDVASAPRAAAAEPAPTKPALASRAPVYPSDSVPSGSSAIDRPADRVAALAPAAEEIAPASALPEIDPEASTVTRSPRPVVKVESTVWHPDPTRRYATVRVDGGATLQRVREGDSIGPLAIHEITPSGVVLEDEGGIQQQQRVGAAP